MKGKSKASPAMHKEHGPGPQVKPSQSAKATQGKAIGSFLDQYGQFILPLLLLITCGFLFGKYLTGSALYLFKDIGSDSITNTLPGIFHHAQYLRHTGIPQWSFQQGMGQNLYPFSINDPFNDILYLLGPERIGYNIIYMEFLKLFLIGLTGFAYFRQMGAAATSALAGGFFLAFSGVVVVGGQWSVFSTDALFFIFMLYATELFLRKKNWILFPLAAFFVAFSQPVYLAVEGLFFISYLVFRMIEEYGRNFSMYAKSAGILLGLALLGVGLASFQLFSNVFQILNSPRVGGSASYFESLMATPLFQTVDKAGLGTSVMRFFSNDMLGHGSAFAGKGNYLEAPMFYIGIPALLLFTQAFALFGKRERILYAAFMVLWLLPMIFPYMRYSVWFFAGDYYRIYSLFLSFSILLLAIRSLSVIERSGSINYWVLGATFILLTVLLNVRYFPNEKSVVGSLHSLAQVYLFAYTLIFLLFRSVAWRNVAKLLFLLLLPVEVISLSSSGTLDRPVITNEEMGQKVGYNDYTIEAVDFLKKKDSGFFRIVKNYQSNVSDHINLNEAKMQGYYGTSSYISFNQLNYIRFLEETGVTQKGNEYETRWALGLTNRILLQHFGSVKYLLAKGPLNQFQKMAYDSLTQTGDVKVLRSRYFIPFGYTYDTLITLTEYRKLSNQQKDFCLLRACVMDSAQSGGQEDLPFITSADTAIVYTWDHLRADVNNRRRDTLQISHFSQNHITGRLEMRSKGMFFLSLPFDEGWKITVNGKPATMNRVNIGFSGIILEKGTHTIDLEFSPPYLKEGTRVSLASTGLFVLLLGWFIYSRRKQLKTGLQNKP